ncbi:MAG: BMP family ABC transporter substrate-binding protein [Pyramidobacter sp.]|nr:BMP family ABC transporter substrate-binding protein [Pyramidobacter sp.]
MKTHRYLTQLCLILLFALLSFAPANARQKRKALSVGVVFATSSEDSLYTSAKAGVTRAQSDLRLSITSYLTGYDPSKYDQTVRDAASQNSLVVAVGGSLSASVSAAADTFPDVDFVLIDAKCPHPRVTSIIFHQCEAAYLAGVLAARITAKIAAAVPNSPRKAGIILGDNGAKYPVMLDFLSGYTQGVHDIDRRVEVLQASVQSWNDRPGAQKIAEEMRRRGARVIFQAAGQSGLGVIDAAFKNRFYIIGVDEAQEKLAPGFVLTAVLKNFEQAVYDSIAAKYEGHLRPGATLRYRLWNRGVGLSWTTNSLLPEEMRRELEGVSYRVIDGKIKVASCYDDKGYFKKGLRPIPAGITVVPASGRP